MNFSIQNLKNLKNLKKVFLLQKHFLNLQICRLCSFAEMEQEDKNFSDGYDLAVIGGGIVGIATARELKKRHPSINIALIEKEKTLGLHQSSHNAGMVHAEYKPTANKKTAQLCIEGANMVYDFCDRKGIAYKKCGKLIVATDQFEVLRLKKLFEKYQNDEVPDIQLINSKKIKEIEPFCNGLHAIWSPHNGIVNWYEVTQELGKDFTNMGGKIFCKFQVVEIAKNSEKNADLWPVRIRGAAIDQELLCSFAVTCGGLQADYLAQMTGCNLTPRIVPFRGEYMRLSNQKKHMINTTIYPVPDAQAPSLGVHYTPRLDGSVLLGPHVVLAMAREGYSWSDIHPAEFLDALRYPGFLHLTAQHLRFGMKELVHSALVPLQMNALQKLVPKISKKDLIRGPVGVRAQALQPDGELIDDFVFDRNGKRPISRYVLHCRNTPSPGATNSLAVAKVIADKVKNEFSLERHLGVEYVQ